MKIRPRKGQDVLPPKVWAAQAGSQVLFLSSPVFETLYEGTRGPGKTDALLADFCQHVGQGFGAAWRGILFRESYPELADVVAKSKAWFELWFPGAKFNESDYVWTFPDGEQLLLRHMSKPDDYRKYHGHAYPWIGWEELTNWANDVCFKLMMSCCRGTMPGMPRKVRATTNPYGKGHNWVKKRYRLPQMRGKIIHTPGDPDVPDSGEPDRVAIHGNIRENRILLDADPHYISRIRAAAANPQQVEAWLNGSWDITSGGMLDDLWRADVHSVARFQVPRSWIIDRSFDWGESKPFSVGWWAESDGTDLVFPSGRVMRTVPGDLFRIAEWYGCQKGEENKGLRMLASDIADGIKFREISHGLAGRVKPGPADSSIFDEENGMCIANDMKKRGIKWEKADKGPGSRKQGWQQIRKRLAGAANLDEEGKLRTGRPREFPGLFVVGEMCPDFMRTVPSLPRSDKDPDDVDTDVEDHAGDESRYRVRFKRKAFNQSSF
jgi:hypothetical protein